MTDFGEPWTYDEMKLTDSRGKIVAYINHDEAIRAHVLKLVNYYPALVEVLEAAEMAALDPRGRLASALAAYREKMK